MKSIGNPSLRRTLIGYGLIGLLALTTPVSAQTYAGCPSLSEQPESFDATIGMAANSTILIGLKQYSSNHVTIRFVDKRRTTLYEEIVWDRSYTRRFRVSELPDGDYTVVVSSRGQRIARPFRLTWKKAEQRIVAINPFLDDWQLARY